MIFIFFNLSIRKQNLSQTIILRPHFVIRMILRVRHIYLRKDYFMFCLSFALHSQISNIFITFHKMNFYNQEAFYLHHIISFFL